MRKLVYFAPIIIFAVILGLAILTGGTIMFPVLWLILFTLSGILLAKGKFWGGLFGVLPGIHMMYMSSVDTGQIISEFTVGIAVILFYLICCIVVFRKNRQQCK